MGECLAKFMFGHAGKRLAYKKRAYGVDVAADHVRSQLKRFAKRRAAAHERIEHSFSIEMMPLIEDIPYPRVFRAERPKRNGAKNRSQPCRPPFVDMVERPVDLLAPALMLGHLAHFHDGKIVFQCCFLALIVEGEFCSERIHSSSTSSMDLRITERETIETGFGACDFKR